MNNMDTGSRKPNGDKPNNPPLIDTQKELEKMTGKGMPEPQANAVLDVLSSFFAAIKGHIDERFAVSEKCMDKHLADVNKSIGDLATDMNRQFAGVDNTQSLMRWVIGLAVVAGIAFSTVLYQKSERVQADVHEAELAVYEVGAEARARDNRQDAKLDVLQVDVLENSAKFDAIDAKFDAFLLESRERDAKQDAKLDAFWAEMREMQADARERDALLLEALKQNQGND